VRRSYIVGAMRHFQPPAAAFTDADELMRARDRGTRPRRRLLLCSLLSGCLLGALLSLTRRASPRASWVSAPPASLCVADAATGQLGQAHTELWGDVVTAAEAHDVVSAADCCAACERSRDCNTWVFCSAPQLCGRQCWLKRNGGGAAQPHASGAAVPWSSGLLSGKALDVSRAELPAADARIAVVALRTLLGDIRLRLRADWSAESVEYVRLLAAQPHLCSSACEFYRAEPAFLLQGSLRARIAPNNITRPGPRHMRRGDVGWAGASYGPDFFVYLGAEPATHWGFEHTVWAEVADEQSFDVAEKINAGQPRATPPGEMHILQTRVPIDLAVDAA